MAIDFTSSNQPHQQPSSLHHIQQSQLTQYQQVLAGIWKIVDNYHTDHRVAAFGFGAKPHYEGLNEDTVHHCFPLTGNSEQLEIEGFDQLMDSYVKAVQSVEFCNPTCFEPLLKKSF